jgi:hypothetical protein
MWFRGATLDGPAADGVMTALASTVVFTGLDGGAPQIRPDRVYGYYLSHRPTHPIVWAPILAVIGVIGVLVRRKGSGNPYEDLDDE